MNSRHARLGERLPKRHIFGMQDKAGEIAVQAVRVPLRYVKIDEPETPTVTYSGEIRESRVLDVLQQAVQQRSRELIDPSEVEWPEVG